MSQPLRFCLGLHVHQPVGNFDHVLQQYLDDVYQPLISALMAGEAWPIALHISGPLLEWLDDHAPTFVDQIGSLARDGRLELLCAGHDEPILAVLSPADRLEQILRHREHLRQRFGVEATGLWLTERVWEPNLPETLQAAGVTFAVVDDRHFAVSGFRRESLHQHFLTESGGARVALFPIDEQLRYLIPFRPTVELVAHFRAMRTAGYPLAVLGDDGEKFGGWPGTAHWLYTEGWLADFLATLRKLRDDGEVVLTRFADALTDTPSGGLAYLPSASYRELEGWSLPSESARALRAVEEEWGTARLASLDGGLLRGGHWRHFLVRYPEANRLHKMMLRLSELSRERGDPPEVRRAIGRAQCNDAYWHGVFGGLYLGFLRGALWQQLAIAESLLRKGQSIDVEQFDYDADGKDELLITSAEMSAVVAPSRGGAVEVLLDLVRHENVLNALTRHPEAYHLPPVHHLSPDPAKVTAEGTASIHDLEATLTEIPPTDRETRALFVDRIVPGDTTLEQFVAGTVAPIYSWASAALSATSLLTDHVVVVRLADARIEKTLHFHDDGGVRCEWKWLPDATDAWFTTELSLSAPLDVSALGAERWEYSIETVARSERGFDRTVQGHAIVLRWPMRAGKAEAMVGR